MIRRAARRLGVAALTVLVTGLPVVLMPGTAHASLPQAWSRTFSTDSRAAPVIADINGDGVPEVVVAGLDGWLHVLRADGSELPGWPRPVVVKGSSPSAVGAAVTVADLDRNGTKEIIVPAGTSVVRNQNGGVVVFNANGTVRWRYIPRDIFTEWGMGPNPDGYTEAVISTPAVGDVDGDGYPDVVFGTLDHRIVAVDRNGHVIRGFPYEHEDTIASSPALYDVDGDGRMEIFIGGDSTAGGAEDWNGGVLRALDWVNGTVVQRWKAREAEGFLSSPAIGDIDGDGKAELVIGAGTFYNNADSRCVHAYNLENGSAVAGWPRCTGGWVVSAPSLADLDGDGRLDVTVASKDGRLYAWRGNGTALWSVVPSSGIGETAGAMSSSPIVADVDGDGRLEVVIMGASSGFVVDGRTGHPERTFGEHWGYLNAAALGKFGSHWRLVVNGFLSGQNRSRVAAFDVPAPRVSSPWPEYRRDHNHDGAFPGHGNVTWSNGNGNGGGMRFVNEPGAVYAVGNATFAGSANTFPHGGIIDAVNDPLGRGYALVARNGALFAFGGFPFRGAPTDLYTVGQFVGAFAHPSGNGYYVFTDRGAIYTYGHVPFYGAATNIPVVGKFVAGLMAPNGKGYYLITDRGAVYTFGHVPFYGAATNIRTVGRFTSAMMAPNGKGYYLVTDRGAVYTFGHVPFYGAATDYVVAPVVDAKMDSSGRGYWLADDQGHLYTFGRIPFPGTVSQYNPGLIVAVF